MSKNTNEDIHSSENSDDNSSVEVRSAGLTDIDKISMELLINNRMFTKYLSRTDPTKYEEFIKYREKITRYEYKIKSITENLLKDPRQKINNDINETFHNYIKSCIYYLENIELQEKCTKDSYSDEEVLFDEKHMIENTPFPKSHWGKQVVKSENNNRTTKNHIEMDMRAFSTQKNI
jgi:hypothetical protein